MSWPDAVALVALLVFVMFLLGAGATTWLEYRKLKLVAAQEDALRRLVSRYEQLAETTMDAQQRVAAEMAELLARSESIEQILRSVE